MNEHPILFSGEMVRAILDGRKTMTRRVIKPQPNDRLVYYGENWPDCQWQTTNSTEYARAHYGNTPRAGVWKCPYGQPGDLLWVRETWGVSAFLNKVKPSDLKQSAQVTYRVDATGSELSHFVWRPSIFMPRWASRITLEVTGVRAERLQEITRTDARAEGVADEAFDLWREDVQAIGMPDGSHIENELDLFANLWDTINAKRGYSWESNPWVWVVEFRVKETK